MFSAMLSNTSCRKRLIFDVSTETAIQQTSRNYSTHALKTYCNYVNVTLIGDHENEINAENDFVTRLCKAWESVQTPTQVW